MVRLKDIAQCTGLTVSSVSKALNHSKEISEETSKRVWEAAQQLGYRPKHSGNQEEKMIGVILPEMQSLYFAGLMQRLSQEIERKGYTTLLMLTCDYSSSVEPFVEKMCKCRPEGMIVYCTAFFSEKEYQCISNSGIPTLLLNESNLSYPVDTISIQTELSVRLAVEHLLELGHRKIGYLGEYKSDSRYKLFCEILKQKQIEINPQYIRHTEKRFEEGGYELACELLKGSELPTAVVASYDQIAFGAMRAFQEHNVKVPKDISIVGFDNIIMNDYCLVPLTSVTSPVDQMGITAVKILLDAIHNSKTHVVQNVFLQSRLVVRRSTCPPMGGSQL